ncbi:putative protein S-acyltransferase 16 [Vitis vinifera]|uniref:Protein S-acyltransferase n=1 Tax=Vitis vinifera TaxID=29760 RepID=A0A438HSD2_VITVI|nr:putative protein S-acyltransferase 16 [Vitis vinifera]
MMMSGRYGELSSSVLRPPSQHVDFVIFQERNRREQKRREKTRRKSNVDKKETKRKANNSHIHLINPPFFKSGCWRRRRFNAGASDRSRANMSPNCKFSLPVFVVASAITYIYFSTVFIFIDMWFGLTTSPGILNAIAFTAVAFMCVLNYVVAILTDPGRVPATFMPDIEDSQSPIHEIKRKVLFLRSWFWHNVLFSVWQFCLSDAMLESGQECQSILIGRILESALGSRSCHVQDLSWEPKVVHVGGDLRYCQKCAHYKPARAHHCRVCRRCVLRMVLLVGSIYNDAEKDEEQSGGSFRNAYVISGLLLVPLSVALMVLLGWHIYLILQNKTTIEYHEGVRALYLAEKGGNVSKNFYDLGAYENLTSVRLLLLNPFLLCGIFKLITYVPATSALPLILTFSWLQGLRKHYTISLLEFISASSPALNLLDESPLWSFFHQIKLEHLQTLVLFHLAFCSSPGFPTLVLVHLGGRILHSPFSSGSKESQCQEYSVLVLGPSIFSWVCPTSKHIGSVVPFQVTQLVVCTTLVVVPFDEKFPSFYPVTPPAVAKIKKFQSYRLALMGGIEY